MANEFMTTVVEYFNGPYGFVTLLAIIICAIWGYNVWKLNKKKKMKLAMQNGALQQTGRPLQETPMGQQINVNVQAPPQSQISPQYVPRQTMEQAETIIKSANMQNQELFDLEEPDSKPWNKIEEDATVLLKRKTENIEKELEEEELRVEKKLVELTETEKGIRTVVDQLRDSYQNVKRQQKTYEYIKRSLQHNKQNKMLMNQ